MPCEDMFMRSWILSYSFRAPARIARGLATNRATTTHEEGEMQLDNLTIGELKSLRGLLGDGIPEHPYPVGQNVFIRTVTMHYTGHLDRVTAGELVLTDASWIADSGRFHVALMNGDLCEVEPFPTGEVIVPRSGVIDVCRWHHALPRSAQ